MVTQPKLIEIEWKPKNKKTNNANLYIFKGLYYQHINIKTKFSKRYKHKGPLV